MYLQSSALRHVSLLALLGCQPGEYDDAPDTAPAQEAEDSAGENDVSEEIDEAVEATGDYLAREKEELQQELGEQMKELDADMARLNERAKELKGDALAEWQEQKPKLEAQRRELGKKMDQISEAGQETWKDFKQNTQQAWNKLKVEIQEVGRYFDQDDGPKVNDPTEEKPTPTPSDES